MWQHGHRYVSRLARVSNYYIIELTMQDFTKINTPLIPENGKKQFLSHLLGLRGVAILFVVLFHLRPDYFSQGFLGVDVFFVISGYLLFRGYDATSGNFRLSHFIQKKILRIIPLLTVIILISSFIVFPLLFSTKAISDVGDCGLSSLLCLSNIHYIYKYSDYFSTDANLNPFLHTWFLSLVVQMYAVWAAGCIILRKFSKCTRIIIVASAAVASCIYFYSLPIHDYLCELHLPVWEQTKPVSYYNTLGRFWQIAAGALICYLPRAKYKGVNTILAVTGALILFYVLLRNTYEPYSGPLYIVIATILTITYLPDTRISHLLENKPMMWVGKISFSLYLIHFSILVVYKRYTKELPDAWACVPLMLLIFIFAWLLWKYVERRTFNLRLTAISFIIAIGLSGVLRFHQQLGVDFFRDNKIQYPVYNLPSMPPHIQQHLSQGYDSSLLISDAGVTGLHHNEYSIASGAQADFLPLGPMNGLPEYVVVGDSHAQQLYAGFNELSKALNINGVFFSSVIIPVYDQYIDASPSYTWSKEKYQAFIAWLKAHPEIHTVVIAQHWKARIDAREIITWDKIRQYRTREACTDNLKQFCTDLQQAGKQVICISQTPILLGFENPQELDQCLEYARWRVFRYGTAMPLHEHDPIILTREMHADKYREEDHILLSLEKEGYCKVLDLREAMFEKGPMFLYSDNILNFRDNGHITPPRAINILTQKTDIFFELIKQQRLNGATQK